MSQGDFSMTDLIEAVLLSAALSADALVVSMCYGAAGVKIRIRSVVIISVICTAFLAVSVFAGSFIAQFISAEITKLIGCGIMCLLGFWKMLDCNEEVSVRDMSVKETLLFSVSLSIDGLAAGIGTGIAGASFLLIMIISLAMTIFAVQMGALIGRRLSGDNSCWNIISGIILVALGIGKLIF